MTGKASPAPGTRRGLGWTLAPFLIFAAIAGMFLYALHAGDPSKLPSALIGKPVPPIAFAPLEGLLASEKPVPGFSGADLAQGKVSVVNFWSSWCVPCVREHPLLKEFGRETGVAIYGVNYKDDPTAARRFLGVHGNPFTAVGTDARGRGAIEWGVYGMPETFVVDGKGRIAYKHVGPITERSLAEQVIPAAKKAQAEAGSTK
jgi:cytochrome c biogenesis protein CcmG/thiol:disulfide interchange protein DsbE